MQSDFPVISCTDKLKANPEILSSRIDNKTILMDADLSLFFSLNPVASCIWELLLQKHLDKTELLTELLKIYEVSAKECSQSLNDFLPKLLEKNLIKLSNHA